MSFIFLFNCSSLCFHAHVTSINKQEYQLALYGQSYRLLYFRGSKITVLKTKIFGTKFLLSYNSASHILDSVQDKTVCSHLQSKGFSWKNKILTQLKN